MTEPTDAQSGALAVFPAWLPGLFICAGISVAALAISSAPMLQRAAVSPLIVAMLLGVAVANFGSRGVAALPERGFALARGPLLRTAIVLYGLRIPLAEMQAVGSGAVVASAVMVVSTLLLAWYAGRRWLGLDGESALLIGAGSAICGAAAVLATEGVLGSRPGKVGVAVATVVVFGSTAMLLYPVLVPWLVDFLGLGWGPIDQGIYIGSTVHEVAHVLAAGAAIGPQVMHAALVTKMIRVCLLVPVLFAIVLVVRRRRTSGEGRRVAMPWFAVAFLAAIVAGPWLSLSDAHARAVAQGDDLLLAAAMASLGLTVRWSVVRAAGTRPLMLGALLFVHLVGSGLIVNLLVS
jgi:uncharacterized integral membrane protein (TIGR00698 family)